MGTLKKSWHRCPDHMRIRATDGLNCSNCGRRLVRTRRTKFDRLMYRDAFECPHCRRRVKHLHTPEVWSLAGTLTFILSPYTRCICCGSPNVRRVPYRDRVDKLSRHPYSVLKGLLRAPLNKCDRCRIQYYDARSIQPTRPIGTPNALD